MNGIGKEAENIGQIITLQFHSFGFSNIQKDMSYVKEMVQHAINAATDEMREAGAAIRVELRDDDLDADCNCEGCVRRRAAAGAWDAVVNK